MSASAGRIGGREASVVVVGGRELRVRAWTLADHLDALAEALALDRGPALDLDPERFTAAVLRRAAGVEVLAIAGDVGAREAALWWALGGDEDDPSSAGPPPAGSRADQRLALREGTATLRRWSWGERRRALAAALDQRARRVDPVGLLRGMLRASVVAIDGDPSPERVARVRGRDIHRLIDAVVDLNTSPSEPDEDAPELAGLAAATLRICRALGWTPAQVDAAPATEVTAILRLLDAGERPGAAPRPAPRGGLARFPDAVIIEIDEG